MAKKPKKVKTVGDKHRYLEFQVVGPGALVLAIWNKHLLDKKYDATTLQLDYAQIIELRDACNTALDL